MNKQPPTTLQNVVIMAALSGLQMVIGISVAFLIPLILTAEDYAAYSIAFRGFTWISAGAVFFVPPILVRFIASYRAKGDRILMARLFRSALFFQSFSCLAVSILFFLKPDILRWLAGSESIAALLVIAFIVFAYSQLFEATLRGFSDFKNVAIGQAIGSSARLAMLVLLYIIGGSVASVVGTILLMHSASLLWFLAVAPGKVPGVRSPISITVFSVKEWDYAIAMGLSGILSLYIWSYVELFILDLYWKGLPQGVEQIASYALAISLAFLPVRFARSISQVLLPRYSAMDQKGKRPQVEQHYQLVTTSSAIVAVPLSLSAILAMPSILHLFFGPTYEDTSFYFALLQIPAMLLCINQAGAAALPALSGHHLTLAINTAIAPLCFFTAWLLIPSYGATAAAINNVVMQSTAIIATIVVLQWKRSVAFPVRPVGLIIIVSTFISGGVALALSLSPWKLINITASVFTGLLLMSISWNLPGVLSKSQKAQIGSSVNRSFSKFLHRPGCHEGSMS